MGDDLTHVIQNNTSTSKLQTIIRGLGNDDTQLGALTAVKDTCNPSTTITHSKSFVKMFRATLYLLSFAAPCSSFTLSANPTMSALLLHQSSSNESPQTRQIDVSDLGLTMDDMNAPLPSNFLQAVETSGYESTSRLPDVNDDACYWTETDSSMKATLAIPGLRGQPAMCLSVLTATNTVSVTAFGRVVWSCILRGRVKPETAKFESEEGSNMIPIVRFEAKKEDYGERWGGFILQIGEDSIL